MTRVLLPDAHSTEQFGARLAHALAPGDSIALFGDLGAGKTTLARGILRALGLTGEVASPTFPIVQTYDPPDVPFPVWHVDLYRVEDPSELDELGLDEARGDSLMLVEWPDRLPRLWDDMLQLVLEPLAGGGRALTARLPPAWEGRWPQ